MVAEHQPRERAVACQRCYLLTRRTTWNLDAVCDGCSSARQARLDADQPNDQPHEQEAS